VALQTMHNAVATAGRLKPGETLLIQGASSGVGLMGMQIGKFFGRVAGARFLDQCAAPVAAFGVWLRRRDRYR
jgi:NADPH:quinone reductase-like Zn-dependent oxidoreductase